MLVCNVVLRPERHIIAADIIEAVTALDDPTLGTIHATLTDDPGNALDILNAFVGANIVETASAAAVVNAVSVHPAVVLEETGAALAVQDAGVTAATIYATWDTATVSNVTLSGGNLIATNTAKAPANQGASVAAANAKATGKYYFEATFITITGGANLGVGVGTTTSTYSGLGGSATTGDNGLRTGAVWANGANTGISVGAYSNTQIVGIAVDLGNRKIWFRHAPSGNWNGNASYNPAANTGGITVPAGTMVPFVTFGGSGGAANNVVSGNFGASAFSGAVPSGFTAGWPVGAAVPGISAVVETASADAIANAAAIYGTTIAEAASAVSVQNAAAAGLTSTVTWDPATVTAVTLSGGNLVATSTDGTTSVDQGAHVAAADGRTSGKYYFEITITAATYMSSGMTVGIGTPTSTYPGMGGTGLGTTGVSLLEIFGGIYASTVSSGYNLGARSVGDVIGIATDLDNRKTWFRVAPSGNWNNDGTANPATNTNGATTPAGTMVPFCTFGGSPGSAGSIATANFGASSFTGTVPSGFAPGWSVAASASVSEAASAADAPGATVVTPVVGLVSETATADTAQDATVTPASGVIASAMADTVFVNSDGTARQAYADGVMLNL